MRNQPSPETSSGSGRLCSPDPGRTIAWCTPTARPRWPVCAMFGLSVHDLSLRARIAHAEAHRESDTGWRRRIIDHGHTRSPQHYDAPELTTTVKSHSGRGGGVDALEVAVWTVLAVGSAGRCGRPLGRHDQVQPLRRPRGPAPGADRRDRVHRPGVRRRGHRVHRLFQAWLVRRLGGPLLHQHLRRHLHQRRRGATRSSTSPAPGPSSMLPSTSDPRPATTASGTGSRSRHGARGCPRTSSSSRSGAPAR